MEDLVFKILAAVIFSLATTEVIVSIWKILFMNESGIKPNWFYVLQNFMIAVLFFLLLNYSREEVGYDVFLPLIMTIAFTAELFMTIKLMTKNLNHMKEIDIEKGKYGITDQDGEVDIVSGPVMLEVLEQIHTCHIISTIQAALIMSYGLIHIALMMIP